MTLPEPRRVLNLFRMGNDTSQIAARLKLSEAVICRLLEAGRDIEWFERQRERERREPV